MRYGINRNADTHLDGFFITEHYKMAIDSGIFKVEEKNLKKMGNNYIECALSAVQQKINDYEKKSSRNANYRSILQSMKSDEEKLMAELKSRYGKIF